MDLKEGNYIFECSPMPWTEYELGVHDISIDIPLELSNENIHSLVDIMHWAWRNEWFEHSTSETVFTELLQKRVPHLYDRIQPLVHQQFCHLYPNNENVEGFGVYEIFIPDKIIKYASSLHESNK